MFLSKYLQFFLQPQLFQVEPPTGSARNPPTHTGWLRGNSMRRPMSECLGRIPNVCNFTVPISQSKTRASDKLVLA